MSDIDHEELRRLVRDRLQELYPELSRWLITESLASIVPPVWDVLEKMIPRRRLGGPAYALNPEGPTEVLTKDGLLIPWRPIMYAADGAAAIHEGHADATLVYRGYWFVICSECAGDGQFLMPDDSAMDCVSCRGTGYAPLGML